MPIPYNKPPLTPEQQADLLLSRGLRGISKADEDFKRHYEEKYDPNFMPPAWMIFETSTFGLVSKFYDNIDSSLPEKAVVARFFGFSKAAVPILVSWMRHLTNLRNICAHHSRLYSKINIVKPKFPRKIAGYWVTSWPDSGKIYASVCIVKKLLDACSIEYDFVSELKKIMHSVRVEQLESMGFPNDWDKEKLFC